MARKKNTRKEDSDDENEGQLNSSNSSTAASKKGGRRGKGKNSKPGDDDDFNQGEEEVVLDHASAKDIQQLPKGVGKGVKQGKGRKNRAGDDDDFKVELDIGNGNGVSGSAVTSVADEEDGEVSFTGKKKGKSKGKMSDAYSALADMEEAEMESWQEKKEEHLVVEDEEDLVFSGKKRGKKKEKKPDPFSILADMGENDPEVEDYQDKEEVKVDEEEAVVFTGKKKGKKKVAKVDIFSALADMEDSKLETEEDKSEKIREEQEEEEDTMVLSGEKKGMKKEKKVEPFSLLATMSEEDVGESVPQELAEEEEVEALLFTGKKKKGKKSKKTESFDNDFMPEVAEEEAAVAVDQPVEEGAEEEEALVFTGKKKKGKKKGEPKVSQDEDEEKKEKEAEADLPSLVTEEEKPASAAGGKKKEKKKKGKKAATQTTEDDDIDAILAMLDGPPPASAAPAPEVSKPAAPVAFEEAPTVSGEGTPAATEATEIQAEGEEGEAGDIPGESAAAKKKRKKKERELAKKTAAAAAAAGPGKVEGGDSSAAAASAPATAASKKLPKHVREMQERLARIKEAEEKAKAEAEERVRREEEEAARLAEAERLKEEAKRRKKEREKEKIAALKREGKFLSAKEREERKKLAAFREQLLMQQGGGQLAVGENENKTAVGEKKKVVYERKKKNRGPGVAKEEAEPVEPKQEEEGGKQKDEVAADAVENQAEAEVADVKVVADVKEMEEVELEKEKKVEEEPAVKEVEDEEEDDWDAKSWDEEDLKISLKKKTEEEEEEVEEAKEKEMNVAGKQGKKKERVAGGGVEKASSAASGKGTTTTAEKKKEEKKAAMEEEAEEGEEDSEEEDDEDNEGSGSDSGSEYSDSESESEEDAATLRKEASRKKRLARHELALASRSSADLRSPICCILGHVDTGKTKLLDCIRKTNVQEGEAGGITQQIGATYFPAENIREKTKELKADAELRVPGLLIIDTPGHESFTNLRARGSGLCDIAILVIDIMHGIEPQTLESINLLKMRKTPFIVALNKVDRMYGWVPCPHMPIRNALKEQKKDAVLEFERRADNAINQLMEQGLNAALYWKNPDIRKYISVVPTSAFNGEGIPDLLMLLVQLTQKMMEERLMFVSEVQCTVLEVKVIEGLGTTIDVVLVNGVLHEGDQIVVCGLQGPIVTNIRALLTPHPMKELRVKGSYVHHKELKAAQGIKITAQGLEHAIAGTQLYVVGEDDFVEDLKEEAMADVKGVLSRISRTGEGVCVQASTLGSLEALLEFLKSPDVKIPVSGIAIGPVHKKDVMRASVMLERKKKEYAVILAFDVKVSAEAQEVAKDLGVTIFTADIIYHLFDQFTAYMKGIKDKAKEAAAEEAVFPVVLKIMPNCIFNKKDPIVLGVEVVEGIAKIGTPICIPSQDFCDIGKIASMEKDHKVVDIAKKGQAIAMKIVGSNAEELQKSYGRHFTEEDELVSHISRHSIDLLKENFRNDLTKDDWLLVLKLKKVFDIQ